MTETRDFTRTFLRIGCLSFGGPAAQIALMHRELVDESHWLTEEQFAGALSFCMLLPGPEAMQLATYAGWRLRGVPGGLFAGLAFVLPGAAVIMLLALAYITYGAQPGLQAAFLGVKAAVITLVASALWKLSRRALTSPVAMAIAAGAFAGLFVFGAPFPLILVAAALIGAVAFSTSPSDKPQVPGPAPNLSQTAALVAKGTALWLTPLALLWFTGQSFLASLGAYFAQLALLSFGGAYALLGWMTQTLVQDHGWITSGQMIDALGLAEPTPGPLILVTQFVGHLSGYGQGGLLLGLAAGLLTIWMVFVPCFLFIFAGAPHLERLLAMPRLRAALTGITAAVTGVIASLSVWFALSVLWPAGGGGPALNALGLIATGAALFALGRGNLFVLIFGNAVLGWLIFALGLV